MAHPHEIKIGGLSEWSEAAGTWILVDCQRVNRLHNLYQLLAFFYHICGVVRTTRASPFCEFVVILAFAVCLPTKLRVVFVRHACAVAMVYRCPVLSWAHHGVAVCDMFELHFVSVLLQFGHMTAAPFRHPGRHSQLVPVLLCLRSREICY
jgi:hypothetical protein